ncbi:hypothetical protein [Pseudomonas gingeri]|uniref:hypothetical protein n=1 Tax=Pseudomonas gingeri TaxID=117681 RepID=UPI003527390C
MPLRFLLSGGQASDIAYAQPLLDEAYIPSLRGRPRKRCRWLLADKDYDAEVLRRYCDRYRMQPVIPLRASTSLQQVSRRWSRWLVPCGVCDSTFRTEPRAVRCTSQKWTRSQRSPSASTLSSNLLPLRWMSCSPQRPKRFVAAIYAMGASSKFSFTSKPSLVAPFAYQRPALGGTRGAAERNEAFRPCQG